MGLLSHLWHVINREIIAGSLQWLETTQIPENDASIPTPRPHFSLCPRSRVPPTLITRCGDGTSDPRAAGFSAWPGFPFWRSAQSPCPPCLVSQRSLTLRAFIPRPCFQEAGLWSLPGCKERTLMPFPPQARLRPARALFKGQPTSGTLQNPRKKGLSHICTQWLFFQGL